MNIQDPFGKCASDCNLSNLAAGDSSLVDVSLFDMPSSRFVSFAQIGRNFVSKSHFPKGSNERAKVMGVYFDPVTRNEALDKIFFMLKDEKQHQVVTPNPEILLKAQKDAKYRAVLNRASMSVADGTGIIWAASLEGSISIKKGLWHMFLMLFRPKKLTQILPERVTGTDLMGDVLDRASKNGNNYKIFLLGAREGAAEQIRQNYHFKDKNCQIVGTYEGSPCASEEVSIVAKVREAKPDILFVAYGSPNQEKWIYRNLKKMPSVQVAMGVGGAFDFIAGRVKRAPACFRKMGFEWLWRLINQPRRLRRIWNAVFVFPYLVVVRRINIRFVK